MIRILIVLLVYVIGPALILWWAVRRYKSGVKPDLLEVVAVSFAVIVITVSIYFLSSNVSSEEDRLMAESMAQELVTQYPFPVNRRSDINKAAVFGEAEDGVAVIRIYGVIDSIEQEKIVSLIEEMRKKSTQLNTASNPIAVKFFQKEIWEEGGDSKLNPVRKKETLLHRYLLE